MTRDDAIRLLGISRDHDDPGTIREAHDAQAAAVAQRGASAPTPALREKYQQQAERLRQARDLLLGDAQTRNDPGPLSLTKQLDLPARAPITTGLSGPGAAAQPVDNPLTLTRQADLPARSPVATASGRSAPGESDAGDTAAVDVIPGHVLADRYEVCAQLGSGGMGAVFAALDRVREEEVAIKVLLPHLLADPKARERFLNEARIASNLSHPNIVRVFDVQQTTGLTFLTMEHLKGRSLRQEITRRQQTAERFKPAEVLAIAEPLCGALHHAHGFTVHRDVKPENVWLGEDGTVKLMDFGIARLLRPSQFTSTGLALGTAYYMAPEQLRGQEVDHRADQFALAVVLYELLTGEVPQGVVKPPHQLRRSVPAGMSQAIMKALEARPEARHADVAAFGRALTSRPGSGVGTRSVVAIAVAVLLGAVVTFPWWRSWTAGVSDAPGPMGVTPAVTAESKAAESAYRRQWDEVGALRDAIYDPRRALTNSVGIKLALIPAGEFLMGSPDTDKDADGDEKPQHRVRITRPFYLGVHEVTRGQFRRFVDEAGYQTEAEKDGKGGRGWNEDAKKFEQNPRYTWREAGFEQTDEHPVVNVSWNDAVAFAEWLSRKEGVIYRLPTEAEWEYACRAGTTTKYCSGDDPEGLAAVANIADGTAKTKYPDWTTIAAQDGFIYTAAVGRYNPNAWGLFDMHGNVWEWCSDGYAADYYKRSPVDDPPGPDGASLRVYRGGGWSGGPRSVRSAYRDWRVPGYRSSSLGFRLARVQSVR